MEGHMSKNFQIAPGMRFGRLTVVRFAGLTPYHHQQWLCCCDCGVERTFLRGNIRSGDARSCGCLQREKVAGNSYGLRHGHARRGNLSATWKIWSAMWGRCNDTTRRHYGAKGISVCERWRVFENFVVDMGERPSGLTLDRKDGRLGYSKINCRWATPTEQARNSSNARLTIETAVMARQMLADGVSQRAVGERLGVSAGAIGRLSRGETWLVTK
jgi:hypothetical protein